MATPMLLMASEQSITQEPAKTRFGSYEESKPDSAKTAKGNKKSGKGSNAKKQPQRGLGVAQLERLRLQDRWKKMTDMLPHQPQPQPQVVSLPGHQYHQNFQYQNHPIRLPDPLPSVPIQYNASGFGVGGAHNLVTELNSSPYGTGTPDPKFQAEAVYETSGELSSMPKMQSLSSGCCDLCCKKKRFDRGNYMGSNGKSDKSAAVLPINGSDFPGLNAETHGYGAGMMGRAAGYLGHNNQIDEGVAVRAVHRKGSSVGGAVMEYDFFPAAGRSTEMRSSYPKEELHDHHQNRRQTAEASSVVSVGSHEEPSDITATSFVYGIGAVDSSYHDPLDLSLKLSF